MKLLLNKKKILPAALIIVFLYAFWQIPLGTQRIEGEELLKSGPALIDYVNKHGVSETLVKMEELEARLDLFGVCHDRAHEVGIYAYQKFGPNAFERCTERCGGGCYHGAVGSYAAERGIGDFNESLADFCLNSDKYDQCLHGLGHGILAWNEYDLPLALEACNQSTPDPTHRFECWRGVFMENVVGTHYPREIKEYSKYLSDDPSYPCTLFSGKHRDACEQFITFRIGALYGNNYRLVAKACEESIRHPYNYTCFSGLGSNAMDQLKNKFLALSVCGLLTDGMPYDLCAYGVEERIKIKKQNES